MILSVSRRTDIPNYYAEWFYNRIKEGFLYVRNPMNLHQVSRIDLSPQIVDCIVFWTKNPEPMLARLDELNAYHYYFQFTLTGYGKDIEAHVPHKKKRMLPVFRELSDKIGSDRVIWRYDPILFNAVYTEEYHLRAFQQIAEGLKGYTKRCVVSFVDAYLKNKKNLEALNICGKEGAEIRKFAEQLSEIAHGAGMEIGTCAERIDLTGCGIGHNSCIDKQLTEAVLGCKIKAVKDKNQRPECGCVESIDVGSYNTCRNGCSYCYANHSEESVLRNCMNYDVNSPLLCSKLTKEDKITERKMKSCKIR